MSMKQPPLRVEIIRPKRTATNHANMFFARAGAIFLAAWLLMLLLPGFTDLTPGYWQTMAGLLALRIALPTANYLAFTRAPSGDE